MADVLRNPLLPLERRREAVRRLLPLRDGDRPIKFYFDSTAERGWRKALKRATVRHISTTNRNMTPKVVVGAVAAEAGQLDGSGWDLGDGLPTWERELVAGDLEQVGELVGAGADGWA